MAALWALVGMVVGSLLSLLVHRLPRMEKLAAPVYCPHCHVRRPIYAQSALLLLLLGARGRCGGCGAYPDRLALVVEVSTAGAFWLLFLRFGPSQALLLTSLYASFLIVVFFIDWQHRLIPNRVTYPGVIVGILLTPALSPVTLRMALLGVLVGAGAFGLLYGGGYLVYRQEVLGMGDVKLAAMLGAMVGFPAIVLALLLGSFVGAVSAAVMLLTRRGSGHEYMPYGTSMCLGAFASFFADAYSLVGFSIP